MSRAATVPARFVRALTVLPLALTLGLTAPAGAGTTDPADRALGDCSDAGLVVATSTTPGPAPQATDEAVTEPVTPLAESSEPESTTTGDLGSGTGLVLGELGTIEAPIGEPLARSVTAAVANLPNRTSASGFASSMRTLTADDPDFVVLNEVSRRSAEVLRATAPGYTAYRDPVADRSTGGVQSMNNVVLWRTDGWSAVDGGRVKLVDDDRGYHSGRAFTWDRYATWVSLEDTDGAVVSVVSTHMMTNPGKFPRQHGNPPMTRVEQYGHGMDILVDLVAELAEHGSVVVGGDMNSHPGQGSWTAAAKLTSAGLRYTKDRGVMYLFHQDHLTVTDSRQVRVASDHPALVVDLTPDGTTPTAPVNPPAEATPTEDTPTETPTPPASQNSYLTVRLPDGSVLTKQQVANARTILRRGRAADLPRAAWVVAVTAALAESGLVDLGPGTGGRVGLFGQVPDTGWGDADQVGTPAQAADAFFGTAPYARHLGLVDLPWRTMTASEAAGAVQGAVFPEVYANREAQARFIVQALTGARLAGADECGAPDVGECPDTPWPEVEAALVDDAVDVLRCLHAAFPSLAAPAPHSTAESCPGEGGDALDIAVEGQLLGDRVATFLRVHADELDVDHVVWAGGSWSPDEAAAGWRPYLPRVGDTTDDRALLGDRVHVVVEGTSC